METLLETGFLIPGIKVADEASLSKGTYILVLNALDKPPHLSLIVDNHIFSLGVTGPKLAMPLPVQLRVVKARNIKTLFIELHTSLFIHDSQLYRHAKNHTLAYRKVEAGVATCLSPIKNFCSTIFDIDVSNVNYIFDLLPLLYEKKLVKNCFHLNMEKNVVAGEYHLEKYTLQDIYMSIVQAEQQIF